MSLQDARALIGTALDDTMIVEAAAGTGKTTELVGRIVRLIETGRARVGEIVAVTFSEKAAGELKLRLREELERARTKHGDDKPEAALLVQAVHDFEDAHVSTIHGFCAELLRDRPVEACVDPAFIVLNESQAEAIFDEAFSGWLQDALADPGEGVRRSLRRPVRWKSDDEEQNGPIARLRRAADELREWRDHRAAWKRPAYDRRADIKSLVDELRRVAEITDGPLKKGDVLWQDTARLRRVSQEIERLRRIGNEDLDGWEATLVQLADDRDLARSRKGSGTAYKAGISRQAALDALNDLLQRLAAFRDNADADLAALLHEELRGCLERYEARKQSAGALDFLDLLIKARNLVRDQPAVRKRFRERFRVLLDRRVPGHRSAAGRAAASAGERRRRRPPSRRPLHRRRPEAVDLPVPPRRCRRLPPHRRPDEPRRRDAGDAADVVSQRAVDSAVRQRRVSRRDDR